MKSSDRMMGPLSILKGLSLSCAPAVWFQPSTLNVRRLTIGLRAPSPIVWRSLSVALETLRRSEGSSDGVRGAIRLTEVPSNVDLASPLMTWALSTLCRSKGHLLSTEVFFFVPKEPLSLWNRENSLILYGKLLIYSRTLSWFSILVPPPSLLKSWMFHCLLWIIGCHTFAF